MPMTVAQLASEAMALAPAQRGELAELIVASLVKEPDPETDALWAKEAIRRRDEVRAGKVKPIPAEEAEERIAAILEKRK